jgi:hypothetical protein
MRTPASSRATHRTGRGRQAICAACAGKGTVCCHTWAMVRVNADTDLQFNALGMTLWPLSSNLEMVHCPFCGRRFEPKARRT